MTAHQKDKFAAIGLMSGTSCDGVDAALIITNGQDYINLQKGITLDYPLRLKLGIKKIMGSNHNIHEILDVESEITKLHAIAVKTLLKELHLSPEEVDIIGFHGQTIKHMPEKSMTWQMGNIPLLATLTGINVIGDLRRKDMAYGGQGAPLVPVFLQALAAKMPKPLVFLNIGGVANICFVAENRLVAFDVGPGNAPLDDFVFQNLALPFDENGKIASTGKANNNLVQNFLKHEFYGKEPPKSLDRNQFDFNDIHALSIPDATATIVEVIAYSVKVSLEHLKERPIRIIATGGGAKNEYLVQRIAALTQVEVVKASALNLNESMIEAYAFGYLAVRSLLKLPITFPETTGVHQPQSGGVFCRA